jgi:hypothetical protein
MPLHPEPTLESVKGELELDGPFHPVWVCLDLLKLDAEKLGDRSPEVRELYNHAIAGVSLALTGIEKATDRLAPQKLARDHEAWADLEESERSAA